MSKLFNKQMMEYNDVLDNWQDVVVRGVELLVENGYATIELANQIFSSTESYGAYYVIEKGLCLLHANPGPYILKNGASTIILKNYVEFNGQSDKLAKIIITLSADDSNSHIELIKEFGHFFTNEEFKKKALNVKSLSEFNELLSKYK